MNPPTADRIAFRRLPLFVQLGSMVAMFLAWVLFAELIIDRHGLDVYLPFYRIGNLCPYDAAVAALLVSAWIKMRSA